MHSIATTARPLHYSGSTAEPAIAGRLIQSIPLDAARLATTTLTLVALLSINVAGTPGAAIFFAILALMLLSSPQAAFKALAICYLGLMINHSFVPKTPLWTIGRLVLPLLALVRFGIDLSHLRVSLFSRSWYVALIVFVAAMAICSIVSGWYTHIALLKLINFTATVTAILAGTTVLRLRRIDVTEWFVALIVAATLFGIASVVLGLSSNFRDIQVAPGQYIAAKGFNGAFLHPNLHATYASLFVTFLGLVWILGHYRRTWMVVPIIVCWFLFMAWSASRTSLVASVTGIGLLVVCAKPIRNRHREIMRPKLSRGSLVAIVALALIGGFIFDQATGGSVVKQVIAFVNKASVESTEALTLDTEKILSSRKQLLELSWKNFEDSPVCGIGFGVAKTEQFRRTATLFTAPAEKGFLPTAILEEGGVVGAGTFVLFLLTFIRFLLRERNIAGFVTLIAFLATNLGEVTIFSPGGAGSFGWITIGAAMILGDHCWGPPSVANLPASMDHA